MSSGLQSFDWSGFWWSLSFLTVGSSVTMQCLFLTATFFLSTSIAYRDQDGIPCMAHGVGALLTGTGGPCGWDICPCLLPTLNKMPSLHMCFNRRLLPLPRSRSDFSTALLLLLAGDVSVNPGPTHSLRVGTINARSMRDKAPAISDLILTKIIGHFGGHGDLAHHERNKGQLD